MEKNPLPYLKAVIENISDMVSILEADGTIRYCSPSVNQLGFEPEELIGKKVFDFIHPEDRMRVLGVFMEGVIKPGHKDTAEARFRRKDGTWAHVEAWAKNLLFDGLVNGVVVCTRDMSERYTLLDQIRLQAQALQAAGNGIVITDPDGNIQWVNKAFCQTTGYTPEEVRGKNPRILKSGEQPPMVYRDLWLTIRAGRIWRGEMCNRRKDGSIYYEDMVITPLKNEQGTITHFVAVKEDITARKKMEAEFRQAQKMEAIGRLSGGIAHDFNNILTVIMGRADFLSDKLGDNESAQRDLGEIRQAALRASALTRQLLTFSRRQVLQPKIVDLGQVLNGSSLIIQRLIGEDVELKFELMHDLGNVKVDPGQIEQVLMNLAVNARDAMSRGGVLSIRLKEKKIGPGEALPEAGFLEGNYILLEVSDTGEGMSPEVQKRIFEPFFTTKEKGKGTGLGLSTVYGIVKQSNGHIDVQSSLGKGTTFRIYFPVCEKGDDLVDSQARFVEPPVGTETVLLVEDEAIVRQVTAGILARQGYRVLEAVNGVEALHMFRAHRGEPIRMVVTDIVMPFMGGGELTENILGLSPSTRVLLISGYTDTDMVQSWLKRGCSFLQKPFQPAELLYAVRETLDRAGMPA